MSTTYHFGDFHLDPAAREFRRGAEEIRLHRKAFDCIVYLIERRDRAVERDELFQAVWGDVQLSDGVLGQAIVEARRAVDDTGEEQRIIKTVRGFGYRWVAPIESATQHGPAATATDAEIRSRRRPGVSWVLLAVLIVVALVGIQSLTRRDTGSRAFATRPAPRGEGEIMLLLPVKVDADGDSAWIRLGVMDLVAERLRTAGQAMVPSDTVIRLLHDSSPSKDELNRLSELTGAHLILAAEARATGKRWTVSLHSLLGARPPLTAAGEAYDVLEAARAAADRMTVALGLKPAAEPDTEPGLQTLRRKIEAARLAQKMDVARSLIEEAEPHLRQHPEIRFLQGRIEFYSHNLDAAQSILEPLLDEGSTEHDPVFRARVVNLLAAVYGRRGDLDPAASMLEEAARLLDERHDTLDLLGTVRMNLGFIALERGDFAAARKHTAQARRIFESIGDIQGLGWVDNNWGVLEVRRGRFAGALRLFESSAERAAAVRDVAGELRARLNMIVAHLRLLEPQAAARIEPRVRQLQAGMSNAELIARANVCRVDILNATGRGQAARALLDEVLAATEGRSDLGAVRVEALTPYARYMLREGNSELAATVATEVVDRLAVDHNDEIRGRAWLILVRAILAQRDLPAASAASAAFTEWAGNSAVFSSGIYAALAEAETAAAQARDESARAAFERALALATMRNVPLSVLWVAQSYIPWLLTGGANGNPDPDRALLVADRLIGSADQHYEAAVLVLRVYHVLGPPSAWRTALARATALAGERRIPPELLKAPRRIALRF